MKLYQSMSTILLSLDLMKIEIKIMLELVDISNQSLPEFIARDTLSTKIMEVRGQIHLPPEILL